MAEMVAAVRPESRGGECMSRRGNVRRQAIETVRHFKKRGSGS